jgi:hypothetical protein
MAPSTTSRWCCCCPPVALVALAFVALGSVLVGGLGDTGNARHRGKVEAFGGHDGWYASNDSRVVVVDVGRREKRSIEFCAILKSSSQETIDSSLDLCTNVFAVKQSKNSEK